MKVTLPVLGYAVLALLLLASFGIDLKYTAQGGAMDLRNRITGIRLLEDHRDAYHYKWQEGDPERYLDPEDEPSTPNTRTTVSPTMLLLHLPVAILDYRAGQFVWLILQWLLLLATGLLWARRCTTSSQRWLVALFVTGFTYTAIWRLNAERGQAYIPLVFIFAGWLSATLDPKRGNSFAVGFLVGFLVALRTTFLLLVPFLVLHRRGQLPGALAGLLLGVGLPLLWNGSCWSDYSAAMKTHAEHPGIKAGWVRPVYPPTVEGIATEDIMDHFAPIPYSDFSALYYKNRFGLARLSKDLLYFPLVVMFLGWLWWSRSQPIERLLMGVASWIFLSGMFLPAARLSYQDVFILDVFALGLISFTTMSRAAWFCLLALPFGWMAMLFPPPHDLFPNLCTLLLTIGAASFLFTRPGPVLVEKR